MDAQGSGARQEQVGQQREERAVDRIQNGE